MKKKLLIGLLVFSLAAQNPAKATPVIEAVTNVVNIPNDSINSGIDKFKSLDCPQKIAVGAIATSAAVLANKGTEAAKIATDCCFDAAKIKLKTNNLYNWNAKGIAIWGLLGGLENFVVGPLFSSAKQPEDQRSKLSIYKRFLKNMLGGLAPKFFKHSTRCCVDDSKFKTSSFLKSACISASAKTFIPIFMNKFQVKRLFSEALSELKDMAKTNNSEEDSV